MDRNLVDAIVNSFRRGKGVRRNLRSNGKLVIDQKLPYLCIYRFRDQPDRYLDSLIKTQGAYLIVQESVEIQLLLESLSKAAMEEFQSFMMVEIWNDTSSSTFKILYPEGKVSSTISSMEKGLKELAGFLPRLEVEMEGTFDRGPQGFPTLMDLERLKESGVLLVGISIPSIFTSEDNTLSYPLFFRKVRRKFGEIIKIAAFELVRGHTDEKFTSYLMLGKTRLDYVARSADRKIAAIDEKMNFILTVTPINSDSEWEKFKNNHFSELPRFTYRLIPLDPEAEKRKLFNIPLERIEDPTIAFLLRDKRTELEKQLLMLEERGTKRFFHLSQSIYGEIDEKTLNSAASLLNFEVPGEQAEYQGVNAEEFARIADQELEKYRKAFPEINLCVKVKESVTGLIVSGPELSVGKNLRISEERVNALIQHEVGTHMLTYCNGRIQPLNLMYSGFAGYDQLQEGLAVLSEFLVGGLNINRLRLLAARILAVNAMIHGADFIECYNLLRNVHGFEAKTSFNIATRVFRGGGYTKDAIYLKGLIQVLEYIKEGGDIARLYAGKYALDHLPLIEELTHLRIIQPPVLPDYLLSKEAEEKINRIKQGISLRDLTV